MTGRSAGRGAHEEPSARLSTVLGQLIRMLRRDVPIEIGPGSLAALATVVRSGPLRPGELALREGVAPPTMTRIVAALEAAGHVVREPDPADRRAARLTATATGIGLVEHVTAGRAAALLERLRTLPSEQHAALVAALPALEALAADPDR